VSFLPFAVAAWIFLVGLYGLVTSRHLVHMVICLTVVQSSTYVLLLAVGYRSHAKAPIFADIPGHSQVVDPVVQALTLTDVVVSVAVVALLLALALEVRKRESTADPDRLGVMEG
jgi:multicomponent Na+:H+ antiporter subunit C